MEGDEFHDVNNDKDFLLAKLFFSTIHLLSMTEDLQKDFDY